MKTNNCNIENVSSPEIEKQIVFTSQKQIITTQVKFSSKGDFAEILNKCLQKINFLEQQLKILKSQKEGEKCVVSPGSPVYELWDNEEDDIWNNI